MGDINIYINEPPVEHKIQRSKPVPSLRILYTHGLGSTCAEMKLRITKIANAQALQESVTPLNATSNQNK